MTQALVAVITALVLAGAGLRALAWARRRAALRGIDPEAVIRQRRGVSMRVLVQGTRVLPGMSLRHANRTTGDLVLLADRFVLTTGKGVIADLRADRGRRFRSVRCTGPGRLVIEGEVPVPGDRPPGRYRVELLLEDAAVWARDLAPWAEAGSEFTSLDRGEPP